MKTCASWRGWILLFSAVWVMPFAAAQEPGMGPGGGPPPRVIQDIGQKLAAVHADPSAKAQMLEQVKNRMTLRGVSQVDARLAAIARVFDSASAMSNADFQKNQPGLVQQILAQMRPGGGPPPDHAEPDTPATVSTPAARPTGAAAPRSTTVIPWMDVHDHLVPEGRDFSGAVRAAVEMMDQYHISKMICMPPPQATAHYECDAFATALRAYRSRFAFLGGGGSLNCMLQQAGRQTGISASQRREFEQKAREILRMGAAGFGEMTAHHLSLHGTEHPYESVPADHPLLFLLADIAAQYDVPIDLHLDLVAQDMPAPDWLTSPLNPRFFPANLAGFERLLDHNPRAKICWAHAGSDNLGHWTAELSRRLLQKHPNLYMSLRMGPAHHPQNHPLTNDGQIKPEWLDMFQEFPNRFVIGNDQFILSASSHGQTPAADFARLAPMTRKRTPEFLSALPPDLARKIASDNAIALYRLKN